MRKVAYVFFFILLVVAIIVMIGGNPLSFFNPSTQATHSKVDVGFVVLNQSNEFARVNFEDIAPDVPYVGINREDSTAENTTKTTHIQLIRGYNLDATGNASSWIFVVRQPEQVSLVTYDCSGEKVNAWLGGYPEKEIIISQIITPRVLFEKSRVQIFPTPQIITAEFRELALAEGNYYLTITGQGKTRYLVFDAKTGALTSSND
ncbi:MAG: hypothetical protein Q8N94_01695 [Methanoregula sp.]|nr:hypothetical protein [Methanoregula sp.]